MGFFSPFATLDMYVDITYLSSFFLFFILLMIQHSVTSFLPHRVILTPLPSTYSSHGLASDDLTQSTSHPNQFHPKINLSHKPRLDLLPRSGGGRGGILGRMRGIQNKKRKKRERTSSYPPSFFSFCRVADIQCILSMHAYTYDTNQLLP